MFQIQIPEEKEHKEFYQKHNKVEKLLYKKKLLYKILFLLQEKIMSTY